MRYSEYEESLPRGREGFPFAYYYVDSSHPRYIMTPHWHNEYEFIRVIKGSFELTVNNRDFRLGEGDTAFVSNNMLHSGIPHDCTYECIVFDLEFYIKSHHTKELKEIVNQQKRIDTIFLHDDMDFTGILDGIFTALRNEQTGYSFIAEGGIWQFLGMVIGKGRFTGRYELPPAYSKKFRELKIVLNYIDMHYSDAITLKDLAEAVHMNPNYFCRFFKEMLGKTPVEYLNLYRIEQACEKLRTQNTNVLNVALSCGFGDVNYFIKVFKRYKGVTPLKYAKAED